MPEAPAAPHVLFVCIGNAGRSQMAEGFARALSGGRVVAVSAGSHPAGYLLESVVRLMGERGIDLSGHRSKGLDEVPRDVHWGAIVTMGCGDACPYLPARRRVDWELPDPTTLSESEVRALRDRIETLVRKLLRELEADRQAAG